VSLAHGLLVGSGHAGCWRSCSGAEPLSAWCALGDGAQQKGKQPQQKGKGKAKGGGGGPSNNAAAAGSSSGEASTSRGQGSGPSTLPSGGAGHCSTVEDAVQPALPSAEAASDTQQPAGGGKKEKERQRKERQRQRKMDEAWEALQVALETMAFARCASPLWLMCIGRYPPFPGSVYVQLVRRTHVRRRVCGCSGESKLGAVEVATAEAAKHGDRSSERLTALVAEARGVIEQAKAEQAERARAAAEAAAVAAAVEAAERLRVEEEVAVLTLSMQSDALRLQQMQAQLGDSVVPPAAARTPHPDAEETMCVVCFDAPKEYAIVPCGHQCVCASCAEQLTKTRTPTCPVCREPIQQTMKVFCS
jgi:hypothetical protein